MIATAGTLRDALARRGFEVSAAEKFGAEICVIEADPRGLPIAVEVADFGSAGGFRWTAGAGHFYDAPHGIETDALVDKVIDTLELPEYGHAIGYLSLAQVAERVGVLPGSMSRYKLPPPDAIVGPVNDDGTLPRGTTRGWLATTIDRWNATRPGRGARTDLADR